MIWAQKKIGRNIYFANRYFDLDYKNYVMLRLLKFQNIMLVYFLFKQRIDSAPHFSCF